MNPELACLLLEAAWELKRPEGKSAEETLDGLDEQSRAMWYRAAEAATTYFMGEC